MGKQNGMALQYASENLRGDYEVVLAAVKQNGRALWQSPEVLRGDQEVVRAACSACENALTPRLKTPRSGQTPRMPGTSTPRQTPRSRINFTSPAKAQTG